MHVHNKAIVAALLVAVITTGVSAQNKKIDTLELKPLTKVVRATLKPVESGPTRIPVITWGGDVIAIDAESEGIFKDEGLEVQLFCEHDFAKQVQGVLDGRTPYMRGTMG